MEKTGGSTVPIDPRSPGQPRTPLHSKNKAGAASGKKTTSPFTFNFEGVAEGSGGEDEEKRNSSSKEGENEVEEVDTSEVDLQLQAD
jgi:hypothetical protein